MFTRYVLLCSPWSSSVLSVMEMQDHAGTCTTQKKILKVLNVMRVNFLTSETCCNYGEILHKYRDKTIQFTNWYIIFSIVVIIQWLIYPLGIDKFIISGNSNVRYKNIMNLRYDVSTYTYNRYIIIFFLMETTTLLFAMYFMVMADLILISFCSANYSTESTHSCVQKHRARRQISNKKTQSFYSAMKPIVLLAVAINLTLIIMLTYLFILRELVNLSLYSCDWTKMNLKFKKLLLLSMQMNNAYQMLIKVSPKKIINLQLFASIISMSYDVVSVMLKTTTSKSSR